MKTAFYLCVSFLFTSIILRRNVVSVVKALWMYELDEE